MDPGHVASQGRPSRRTGNRVPEPGTRSVKWLVSLTGKGPKADANRAQFPRSSVAAWEAVVNHGTYQPTPDDHLLDEQESNEGVEANARLTSMTAAVLLVLLAAEGLTILRVRALLTPHVVIGMVLVPVVLLKIGSTTWRFARYYLGDPEYRRKGPPPLLLRLLGPFVVVLTVAVLGTGIALLLSPTTGRSQWLFLHKATFVLWLGAMTLHVLGHLLDTARLAPRDFYWRTRAQVHGASARQWLVVGAVAIGGILALAAIPKIGPWQAVGPVSPPGAAQHGSSATPSSSLTAGSNR
jgi:hypothetical protein